jgi:DNA-binding LytR/AlgR family response regulator
MEIIEVIEIFDFSQQELTIFRIHGTDEKIRVSNVLYITCEKNYCTIFLNTGETRLDRELLKTYDENLTHLGFMRIRDNTLVNAKYITDIELEKVDKKCFLGEITLKVTKGKAKLIKETKLYRQIIFQKGKLFQKKTNYFPERQIIFEEGKL